MKQIYEFLNEIKTDSDGYKSIEMSEFEKEQIKKRFHKNRRNMAAWKKTVAAACTLLCITGLMAGLFGGQVKAAVKTLGDTLEYIFWSNKDVAAYETVVHSTEKDEGIEVELEAVILDDREMVVSTRQKYPTKIQPEKIQRWAFGEYESMEQVKKEVQKYGIDCGHPMLLGDVFIGKKRLNSLAVADTFQTGEKEVRVIYSFDMRSDGKPLNIEKKNKIRVEFQKITGNTKGNWEFSFEADGKDLFSETITLPINRTFTLPDGERLVLTEYKYNALGPKIYYKSSKVGSYQLQLRGKDDQERSMIFYDEGADKNGMGKFGISGVSFSIRAEDAKTMTLDLYTQKIIKGQTPSNAINAYKPRNTPITIQTQR